MRHVLLLLTVLAMTGIASASLLGPNAGFELGHTDDWGEWGSGSDSGGWWGWGENTVAVEDGTAHTGDWYGTITADWASAWWVHGNAYQEIEAGAGPYEISAWVRSTGTLDDEVYLFFEYTAEIPWPSDNAFRTRIDAYIPIVNDGTWQFVTADEGTIGESTVIVPFEAPAGTQMIRAIVGALAPYPENFMELDVDDLSLLGFAAYNPIPAYESVVGTVPVLTDLAWTNPEPENPAAPITVDVYWLDAGTSPRENDPNLGPVITDPGVVQLVDGLAVETVAVPSVTADHYYYWAVHVTDPTTALSLSGTAWSYKVVSDTIPVPDAGPDVYQGGSSTYILNGSVDDDGTSPLTTLWTWDGPAFPFVTIANPSSLVTTATIPVTNNLPKVYTFTLTATDSSTLFDGSLATPVSDTMTAYTFKTPCEAVYADPADATFPGDKTGPGGTPDCIVDLNDFALLASEWLGCMSTKMGCTP